MIKGVARVIKDSLALALGGLLYVFGERVPESSYQAMIRLFCLTGGRSNDFMAGLVRISQRTIVLPQPRGELGVAGSADAKRIAKQIGRDGYHVFDERLPADVCDRLLQFALRTHARVRPAKDEPAVPGKVRREIYDRRHPVAVRYDFDSGDVLNCPGVQSVLANPAILAVAQNYLNSTPVADVVSMWWHTAFSSQPDEEAGQFFHFDMDRIKWLKFFVYLTDVGPDNGPHCFVSGSHRTRGIPRQLLKKGYTRLTDEEVSQHYSPDRTVRFLAPRGTVLVEDTRGLHKGLELRTGDRLMLQIQFSNSLFGGFYPAAALHPNTAELKEMATAYPRIYRNYLSRDR